MPDSGKLARVPWELLIGQLLTAAITVAAVYLAARVGFEQTIRYTRYQEATDTILILQVVGAELEDNLREIEEFGRYAQAMPDDGLLLVDRVYSIRTHAFDGANENDMYFRQGPDVIVGVRRFYERAGDLRAYLSTVDRAVGDEQTRLGFRAEVVKAAWAEFKPHLDQARNALAPLIAKRIGELEEIRREAYGEGTPPVPGPAPPSPSPS